MYVKLFHAGEWEELEEKVNKYLRRYKTEPKESHYMDVPGYNASVMLTFIGEEPEDLRPEQAPIKAASYYCSCYNCPARNRGGQGGSGGNGK